MTEDNSVHALGTQTYTMGDVLLTSILTRLKSNPAFFDAQLKYRPCLSEYFTIVKKRPSYIAANMTYPAIPNTFVVTCGILIMVYILSLIVWVFYQTYNLETFLLIFGSIVLIFYSLIALLGLIGKCRLSSFQDEMKTR